MGGISRSWNMIEIIIILKMDIIRELGDSKRHKASYFHLLYLRSCLLEFQTKFFLRHSETLKPETHYESQT